uniref:Uncharacterized protein n=1 Tax=Populus trichocarpa TaxID=3694 RepID=A0A3N7G8D7_POPTR
MVAKSNPACRKIERFLCHLRQSYKASWLVKEIFNQETS